MSIPMFTPANSNDDHPAPQFLPSSPAKGPQTKTKVANAGVEIHDQNMEDKDVRRLQDRIEASSREAQLRLDAVMARIDGRFASIDEKFGTISTAILEIKSDLSETRSATRNWGLTLLVTIVASAIAVGGVVVGVKQVWIGGVQVGQAISAQPPAAKP